MGMGGLGGAKPIELKAFLSPTDIVPSPKAFQCDSQTLQYSAQSPGVNQDGFRWEQVQSLRKCFINIQPARQKQPPL